MKNKLTFFIDSTNRFVLERFNAWVWWLLAIVAYAGSRMTQMWLDGHYVRSQFPVNFFVGQTTFNAAELKSYYAHMIEKGTLDVYYFVQTIDYLFMVTAALSLFLFAVAALRTIPAAIRKGRLLKVAKFIMWATPLAAGMDAIENLISFVMLANPQDFADWLVYPYSSFAVTKFALFVVNYLWVLLVLLGTVLYWIGRGMGRLFSSPKKVAV